MTWFKKKERRMFPRYDVAIDFMYGHDEELTASTLVQVSEGGLAFRSQHAFEPGTALDFRALLDPGNPDDGWVVGRCSVMRCEEGRVGARIESLSSKDERRLQGLLRTLSSAQPASPAVQ